MTSNGKLQGAQSGGLLISSLIMLVLIVLSFALGFIVGKQRGQQDVPPANLSVEDVLQRELAKQADTVEGKQQYEFFSKLSKGKSEPAEVKVVAKEPSATKTEKETKLEKQSSSEVKTSEVTEESNKRYTVQVGSFQSSNRADKMINDLKGLEWKLYVRQVDLAEKGIWWRVYVGEFENEALATKAADVLQAKTGRRPLVTLLSGRQ